MSDDIKDFLKEAKKPKPPKKDPIRGVSTDLLFVPEFQLQSYKIDIRNATFIEIKGNLK